MKEARELIGQEATMIVELNNYTYPRNGAKSGDFAIAKVRVKKYVKGEVPLEFSENYEGDCLVVAIAGRMPRMDPGEEYVFTGKMAVDRKYGPQYECVSMRLNYDMKNEADQRNFFSFFMSDRMIDLLFDKFEDPVRLLEEKRIAKLMEIKGIGPATAMRMCAKYEEMKGNGRAYADLKELGLTRNAIDRLVERYGSPDTAVDKVRGNPYILIKEVHGYGWRKADALAQKQGFAPDCKDRVLAFARYYLDYQGDQNGNSWIPVSELLLNVSTECAPVTRENMYAWLKEAMVTDESFDAHMWQRGAGKPVDEDKFLFYKKDEQAVGLLSVRVLEREIADNIVRLKEAEPEFSYDRAEADRIIKETEAEQGYEYTDEQRAAVYKILDNNVTILTGAAGTGKTSSMLAVTRILSHCGVEFGQCALSGRASSNLSEITGCEGKTIHRLLRYRPEINSFMYTKNSQLPLGAVILDEVSMVGGELFLSLIEAIKSGAKLIMIGDPNQLESIGLCNILKDCVQSGYVPTAALTKIHRQAARSGIIVNANSARVGESLVKNSFSGEEVRGELKDFKIQCTNDAELVPYYVCQQYKAIMDQGVSYKDIQAIVPMRLRGPLSCRALNNSIQEMVNPKRPTAAEQTIKFHEQGMEYLTTFRVGDRVIFNHNDYRALNEAGKETAVFNGNIGYITALSSEQMAVRMRDEDETIILARESWFNVSLAYAITCHKAQGTGIPYVVFGLNSGCYVMLSKELVYTAITRAKKYCVVCTQPDIINKAVHTSRVKLKQTWLKDDLKEAFMKGVGDGGFDY